MKGFGENHKYHKKKNIQNNTHTIKDQIINKAFNYHSQGNIQQAKNSMKILLIKVLDHRVFSNYGMILVKVKIKRGGIFNSQSN